MLRHRLLLGPPLIAALIALIWVDEYIEAQTSWSGVVFFPLILFLALAAALELQTIFRAAGIATSRLITCAAVAAGLTASSLTESDLAHGVFSGVAVVCSAGALVFLLAIVYHARKQNPQGVVAAASGTLLAFVYLGLLGGFLVVMRKEYSGWLVMGVLLTTKACDIGAYFTGRAIGRNKLIEWLSPGKTWEGLYGGVLFAGLVGLVMGRFAHHAGLTEPLPYAAGFGMGVLFGFTGQFGDLVASLFKRDAGIKDASKTLPGFGGILDLIDSPLLVAPLAYWVLIFFSPPV